MNKIFIALCMAAMLLSGCDKGEEPQASSTATQTPAAITETGDASVGTESAPGGEAAADAATAADTAAAGDDSQKPAEMAQTEPEAAPVMTGEQVFKKYCFACHMTGAANAPKVGDAAAWEPRIAKGMDALLMSAVEGVPNTAMRPSGGCSNCSEQELMSAIEFMVNQSR